MNLRAVYVVTIEQYYASYWTLEGAFESEADARACALALATKLPRDVHVYRCVGDDVEELEMVVPQSRRYGRG